VCIDSEGSVLGDFFDNTKSARALSEYVFAACAAYALASPSLLEVLVMLVQIVAMVTIMRCFTYSSSPIAATKSFFK
jgi:hypothetical protein